MSRTGNCKIIQIYQFMNQGEMDFFEIELCRVTVVFLDNKYLRKIMDHSKSPGIYFQYSLELSQYVILPKKKFDVLFFQSFQIGYFLSMLNPE